MTAAAASLIAALALVASSLSAAAAEMPAKYRGEWCDHASGTYYMPYHPRQCQRRGIGYLRITAAGYELNAEDDERCRVVRVKINPPSPESFPTEHLITFTCTIDGAEGPQSLTSRFGTTSHRYGRGVRLYIESLDDDQKD